VRRREHHVGGQAGRGDRGAVVLVVVTGR
jgi:hypothetical protein